MVLTIKKQTNGSVFDEEDLSYGPGIVSKLRCRYMNLTLKEPITKLRSPHHEFINKKGTDVYSNTNGNTNETISMLMHKQLQKKHSNDVHMKPVFGNPTSGIKNPNGRCHSAEPTKNTLVESELPPTNVVKSKLQIFEPLSLKFITNPLLKQHNVNATNNKTERDSKNDNYTNLANADRRQYENIEPKKKKKFDVKAEDEDVINTTNTTKISVHKDTSDTRLNNINSENTFEQNSRLIKKNVNDSTIVFNFTDRFNIPDYVSFQNVTDAFPFSNSLVSLNYMFFMSFCPPH